MSASLWRRRAALVAATLVACGCGRIVILHDALTATEHHDLGVAYESAGQRELAAREYKRALKLDAGLGRAWLNLGNVEAAAERWRRAERCYRRALSAMPGDPDPPNNLAVALLHREGDLAEAEALAVRAVDLAAGRDSLYRATLDEVRAARARRGAGR